MTGATGVPARSGAMGYDDAAHLQPDVGHGEQFAVARVMGLPNAA